MAIGNWYRYLGISSRIAKLFFLTEDFFFPKKLSLMPNALQYSFLYLVNQNQYQFAAITHFSKTSYLSSKSRPLMLNFALKHPCQNYF